ncbi:MAG: hypothetical protein JWL59_4750 [Chthoniobacteraceae bacterium]|nr:hypothetical protein [Chthoniobacteraceae bacterium]
MCGWTGYFKPNSGSEFEMRNMTSRMTDTLSHRGPDDSGVWVDAQVGIALGFRRLSIMDLSPAGHQPMLSSSARYVIVFNGEIYNFAELRTVLRLAGHAFRGGSDTEVLLAAVEEWGAEVATKKLSGMFSFALFDKKERSLFLARDPLGKKPLYYGQIGRTLLFGSELKALRQHEDFQADIDLGALSLYLRRNAVPAPVCIYKGIHQLQPGHMLAIPADAQSLPEPIPYWSLQKIAESGMANCLDVSEKEATDQLDGLLRKAVSSRMIADVPLGAFLSGGIDSSTIVALMQAQNHRPVKTFSIGFDECTFNEAQHAKQVAGHLGTDHSELYLTAADALELIPRLPDIYDEPFADMSQIPTHLLCKLARSSVAVSLSGDGGDELFAGYPRYREAERIWRALDIFPAQIRKQVATRLMLMTPNTILGNRIGSILDMCKSSTPEELYHWRVSHYKTPSDIVINGFEPPTPFTESKSWPSWSNFTERMLFLDSISYLPDDIFTKVDRASMAVGLEVRVPMVDTRVLEFAWQLPLKMKMRRGQGKWILRQVLDRYVPRTLVDRPKMGFAVPIGAWLRGPLRVWAEELLDENRLRREGYFHPQIIRQKWTQHLSAQYNWEYFLWTILMFQAWRHRWHC